MREAPHDYPREVSFKMTKRLSFLCILASLCLLLFTGAQAEVVQLPVDDSGGMPPLASGYQGDLAYEDPTIKVSIETGREENCDYWIADIQLTDPAQLRTASAGGFDSTMAMDGPKLARRVNAVLAIDGDYFCYTGSGYILRQGQLYLNKLNGDRDVLLVDELGNFHGRHLAEDGSITGSVRGRKIINAFYFGPILVENGEVCPDVTGQDMAAREKRQRMCIAQVGELHYKAICCAAPARGSAGMTLQQFAEFVARQDVLIAYNLDVGDSTMMIFQNEKINDAKNSSTRRICDIIYFASAWKAE